MKENGAYTGVVQLADVDPHPRNYNGHPAEQLAEIQDSLGQFGYTRRMVLWERADGRYWTVAGNGVLAALKMEQVEAIEATILPADWPEDKVEAYLIADNELAKGAERDNLKLGRLLERLGDQADELPLGLAADERELLRKLAQAEAADDGQPRPVHAPESTSAELVAKWKTAPGQLWAIGDHLLLCADSTEPESWERLFEAAGLSHVAGMITSPPYAQQRAERYGGIEPEAYVTWWLEELDPLIERYLHPQGSWFLNLKAHTEDGRRHTYDKELVLALEARGWTYFEEFAWVKPGRPGAYVNRFKNAWEPIHHFTRDPDDLIANIEEVFEDRLAPMVASWEPLYMAQGHSSTKQDKAVDKVRPSNVLHHGFDQTGVEGDDHPGRFPVALPAFFIRAYSPPGAAWLDFFTGTFTTGVAAQRHGRRALGIERDPAAVAIALQRFVNDFEIEGELLS